MRARTAAQLTTASELADLDWFCGSGMVVEVALAATDAGELEQFAREHFVGETAAGYAALVGRRRGWSVITS